VKENLNYDIVFLNSAAGQNTFSKKMAIAAILQAKFSSLLALK